jgi:hypothetical protein
MLDGVMLLWFVLAAIALLFVAIDIRTTPESPVLKWGFVLVTAYTGVVGAFLYVLGCREPLPGLHEQYVAARWDRPCIASLATASASSPALCSRTFLASPACARSLSNTPLVLRSAGWCSRRCYARHVFGDSYVFVVFEDGTDLYWARSRVLEYLQQIAGRLP